MSHILDRIAESRQRAFRPSSPDEYFAFRLASRLGEPEAAAHYSALVSQHPQEKLVWAFRKTVKRGQSGPNLSHLFHNFLRSNGGGEKLPRPRLVAVRAERRTIGAAVFTGTHLEGRRVLHLSSNPLRAESSAAGFIRSILSESECKSAAIETAPAQEETLRSALHFVMVSQIRASNISLWEISKNTLFTALAHPALQARRSLRELMRSIWTLPNLKQSEFCALDAFALGLYVQTERLFNNF